MPFHYLLKTKHHRIITGLDIGTTKVCAIIGEVDSENRLSILGLGSCPSKGLQGGEITEIQPTINAIYHAVEQAQKMAGNAPIQEVYVGIAGEHILSMNNEAVVEIRHPARGIDEKDRQRVIEKALNIALPENQSLVQHVVQEFRVNEGKVTVNPVGLSGSSLKVHTHLVTGSVDALQNIMRSVRQAGLPQPHIVLQSLASSLSVVKPHELELGVLLVDIGGGTTDVAISVNGAPRATGEIPIGGDLITKDIACVLRCKISVAENLKKSFCCALPEMVDRSRTFKVPSAGDDSHFQEYTEYDLACIIESRLMEIFEFVRDFVEKSALRNKLHAGVVLTGGSALLTGATDVANSILDMPCRVGTPRGFQGITHAVQSPIYATGVGLIMSAMDTNQNALMPRRGIRRLLDYLDKTFA